ncbi:hypothetical protein ACJX0J_007965 [Zea mays]
MEEYSLELDLLAGLELIRLNNFYRPFCVLIDKHVKKGRFLLTDNLIGVAIKSIAQILFFIPMHNNKIGICLLAEIVVDSTIAGMFAFSCENKHVIFYKRNYADLVIWNYLSHICASITCHTPQII